MSSEHVMVQCNQNDKHVLRNLKYLVTQKFRTSAPNSSAGVHACVYGMGACMCVRGYLCKRYTRKFIYSAISNHQVYSMPFTIDSLGDLSIEHHCNFYEKEPSHATMNARRLFVHKYPHPSKVRYSFIE